MDAMSMLKVALWLFLLAAAGGLLMAGIRFGAKRNPPAWIAYAHGLLAAAGLTLLIYGGLALPTLPTPVFGAIWLLLIAAAAGSVLNLFDHWRQLPIPAGLTIAHIVVALLGVAMLFVAVYRTG